jgi:putative flippase GtrA
MVVGATCAAVNLGVGVLVRYAAPFGMEWPSVAAGFFAGTVLSFVLNRRFTFRVHGGAVGPQAVRFALAALATIPLSAVVAEVLTWILRALPVVAASSLAAANLAHIGTIGLLFVFNYLAMKLFALRA